MADRVLATLSVLVGGLGSLLGLLAAFGVELTQNQTEAIVGAAGLVLLVLGAWFHPKVPVGPKG